jgi:hypothetical protein
VLIIGISLQLSRQTLILLIVSFFHGNFALKKYLASLDVSDYLSASFILKSALLSYNLEAVTSF